MIDKIIHDKPIAVVTWGDATYSSLKYYNKHREHHAILTKSVGFLIEYDDEKALLYSDYFVDGDYRNEVLIPTAMIIDIYILDFKQ